MSSFYSIEELNDLNFKSLGTNVLISKKTSIYGASNMSIGNNVRIDDFCILSGNISIGNYVHISAFCALYGKFGIVISDYCGCSARCTLYSATDDFSGEFMISPLVSEKYTNVIGGMIRLEKYSQIGANSVIMPNVIIGEGVATGAFSFINKSLDPWGTYVGIPVTRIKDRSKNILKLSTEFEGELNDQINGRHNNL